MNTPAPDRGLPQSFTKWHNTLPPRELERRMKAAVQSASPDQVEAIDPSLLVGCVDWYQYETPANPDRSN
jgi:hypothetical protein